VKYVMDVRFPYVGCMLLVGLCYQWIEFFFAIAFLSLNIAQVKLLLHLQCY